MTIKDKLRLLARRRPGAALGLVRRYFDSEYYLQSYPDVAQDGQDPVLHYQRIGWAEGRNPHPLFDTEYYLSRYPDLEAAGINPFHHFLEYGWREGRDPSPEFNTNFYLDSNADVAASGINPWVHYIGHGSEEGRAAKPFRFAKRTPEAPAPNVAATRSGQPAAKAGHTPVIPSVKRKTPKPRSGSAAPADTSSWEGLARSDKVFSLNDLPGFAREGMSTAVAEEPVLVSIVMPTWNRRNIIDEAISSVLRQTYQRFELVIADDGSTDGSYDYLTSTYAAQIRSQKIKVISCPHAGVSAARNAGLRAARGDIVAYLDSDNAWLPETLAVYVAALAANPQIDCVYTPISVNDRDLPASEPRVIGNPYDRRELLRSNFIDLNGFAHRRIATVEMGDFNRQLRRLVDWELIIRYTASKPPLYVPVVTTNYYLCSTSLKNITKTEAISPNFDAIISIHRHEYIRENLISADRVVQFWLEDQSGGKTASGPAAFSTPAPDARLKVETVLVLDEVDHEIGMIQDVLSRYWFIDRVLLFNGQTLRNPIAPSGSHFQVSELSDCVLYWPTGKDRMLSPHALFAAVASITYNELDVAVVSHHGHGDDKPDLIHTVFARDSVVVAGPAARSWLSDLAMPRQARGRVLRLDTQHPAHRNRRHRLDDLLAGRFTFAKDKHSFEESGAQGSRLCARPAFDRTSLSWPILNQPVAVIFGMKVAVGGVERLSASIADKLGAKYGTVYVAMEPTLDSQGSLTDDISGAANLLLELFEIVPRDLYADLLDDLNSQYRPMMLFIMNGSMWLAANASTIREIFDGCGIVDHQVYDHEVGWIRRLNDPGMQSFDRYVAVNTKIRKAFAEMGLDDARVEEIHHGIDISNAESARQNLTKSSARALFGLPDDCHIAAFAGRLTDQKRPLDFLRLARARRDTGDHFLFLGDGVLREECLAFIAENNLTNVHHIPFVPNVADAFRAADMLIITSEYEGLPLVVVEAMCVGTPVLSTNVGEISASVGSFGAGKIVSEIGNPDELLSAYEQMIADIDAIQRNADARAPLAQAHYSMQNVVSLFEQAGLQAFQHRALQTGPNTETTQQVS